MKKEKFDGRSRPSNQAYEESWHRIFGSNPVAKQVRTPKFKSQVVPNNSLPRIWILHRQSGRATPTKRGH